MVQDSARWVDWVDHYAGKPNQFVTGMPSWVGDGSQSSLGRSLQFCYWKIQPDEALLMEVTPPRCAYWNFELANRWFNSTDYRYRFSSLNGKQAAFEDDGSVRIAVSHADPGIPNWLDVAGHCIGMVNQRWVEAQDFPLLDAPWSRSPTCRGSCPPTPAASPRSKDASNCIGAKSAWTAASRCKNHHACIRVTKACNCSRIAAAGRHTRLP